MPSTDNNKPVSIRVFYRMLQDRYQSVLCRHLCSLKTLNVKEKRQKRDKTSVILVVIVVVRNSIVRYKICY